MLVVLELAAHLFGWNALLRIPLAAIGSRRRGPSRRPTA
jgi:hypothetical protein